MKFLRDAIRDARMGRRVGDCGCGDGVAGVENVTSGAAVNGAGCTGSAGAGAGTGSGSGIIASTRSNNSVIGGLSGGGGGASNASDLSAKRITVGVGGSGIGDAPIVALETMYFSDSLDTGSNSPFKRWRQSAMVGLEVHFEVLAQMRLL